MRFAEFLEGQRLFDELMQLAEGVDDRDYAIDILDKMTKVAAYLIKSRLNNTNDLTRFEKFLDMIEKELPKLEKSVEAVRKDIRGAHTVTQTPRRFNYN